MDLFILFKCNDGRISYRKTYRPCYGRLDGRDLYLGISYSYTNTRSQAQLFAEQCSEYESEVDQRQCT